MQRRVIETDVLVVGGGGFRAAIDHIYQNLDGTLAYYDHAGCSSGICGRCTGEINGRPGLFCQTPVQGEVTLDPVREDRVLRDLVTLKSRSSKAS